MSGCWVLNCLNQIHTLPSFFQCRELEQEEALQFDGQPHQGKPTLIT
jgi:hypothetical protein